MTLGSKVEGRTEDLGPWRSGVQFLSNRGWEDGSIGVDVGYGTLGPPRGGLSPHPGSILGPWVCLITVKPLTKEKLGPGVSKLVWIEIRTPNSRSQT